MIILQIAIGVLIGQILWAVVQASVKTIMEKKYNYVRGKKREEFYSTN